MATHKPPRPRTYARNRVFSRRGNEKIYESDSRFLFKLMATLIIGAFWLKLATPISVGSFVIASIPIGFMIGLVAISRLEPLQMNRRIWYVVLTLTTIISLFLPTGVVI